MNKIVGLLRVKNEARWIEESIKSILPLCEPVIVLDDHSTDDTVKICQSLPDTIVLKSPFDDLDEARDKQWLMETANQLNPDWVLMIDGDEVLEDGGAEKIRSLINDSSCKVATLRVMYYWNDNKTLRVDRVYSRIIRPSLFRVLGSNFAWKTRGKANLHCTNVPEALLHERIYTPDIVLWHYGYIYPDMREKKFAWYNKIDPNNRLEDHYRHVVQGDPIGPPKDEFLMHAGPMQLMSVSDWLKERKT